MNLRYAPIASALLLAQLASAQVSFGGEPYGRAKSHLLPDASLAVMPLVDAQALMAEDEARIAQGIKGPWRFGYNHMVDFTLENSGTWHTLPNGDGVWRLAIECPGAFSINFEFNDYVVPEGAQVFVYNENETIGSFTAESNPGHTELGVTQVPGDRITIEYIEPANVRGQGRLRIGQVTHAYRDLFKQQKGFGDSGSCNNNVNCPEGDPWDNQIRSVAMITVGGQGICTGQLINNCLNNGTPYFLTANHCLGGNNTWVFRFNWNSPTCTPTTNGPTNQTVSGSTLKTSSQNSDMALLQLNSTPPASYNVFYTGWDKTDTPPTASTCIHHPSGDIKKISFDNNPATATTVTIGYTAQVWRIANWEDGTTEGGSSGSGLWNQNGLLIGQLFGGQASCSNNINDYFGRFGVSYPLLTTWLGSCGNTLQGYPLNTSVGTVADLTELTMAPNPTTGSITVALPSAMRNGGRVLLHDALGQLVYSSTLRSGTDRLVVDLSGRTEGIYLLEAIADGYHKVERVVLTR
ncbi:MAG: trypsin-like peptidase domain-containing protein [Flavobacteriales bacterium]|nr:trypsin-like peptidase domain-containing protein [Flavobacteriales bacterium]